MDTDFLVIGGGIAGASAGYHLAKHGRVTLLEMERAPGYHSTGRSAALFSEYYGNAKIRSLTRHSRPFLAAPPDGFTQHPLLSPRGTLSLCTAGGEAEFDRALADGLTAPVPAREISVEEARQRCPVIRPEWVRRAMLKPAAQDIDVDALHQGYLRGIRAAGGRVICGRRVEALDHQGRRWRVGTSANPTSDPGTGERVEVTAATVVNAAGCWADGIAALAGVPPVGLTPLRRTAAVVDGPAGMPVGDWPMVLDVTETFYFKPESGGLLISPADATPMPPGDARPFDLDVALAIDRVQAATTLSIRRVRRAWAGLRTAAADDVPVIGADPRAPGFIWAAGLGGYGVQTAPAVGELVAAAAVGGMPALGPDPALFSPTRFR